MNKQLIILASLFCALISCKNPLFDENMEEHIQVNNKEEIMNYVSKNKDNLLITMKGQVKKVLVQQM